MSTFLKAHIPDIRNSKHFLDIVFVGTLITLSRAMNPTSYECTTSPEVAQEEVVAKRRFRLFQGWLQKNFVVTIDGQWITVLYVFRRFLLDITSAIFGYLRDRPKLNAVTTKCTHAKFRDIALKILQQDEPELVPMFKDLLNQPKTSLAWTGPPIEIFPRPSMPPCSVLKELADLPSDPVYQNEAGSDDDLNAEEEDIVLRSLDRASSSRPTTLDLDGSEHLIQEEVTVAANDIGADVQMDVDPSALTPSNLPASFAEHQEHGIVRLNHCMPPFLWLKHHLTNHLQRQLAGL